MLVSFGESNPICSDKNVNDTQTIQMRHSKFNVTYPSNIGIYIPKLYELDKINVTPFGQKFGKCNLSTIDKCEVNSTPIWNLSLLHWYNDSNFIQITRINIFLYSC